jgi:hypothetical protein
MQDLQEAEDRLKVYLMENEVTKEEAERYAGDMAAQCYHYLIALAHAELAISKANR